MFGRLRRLAAVNHKESSAPRARASIADGYVIRSSTPALHLLPLSVKLGNYDPNSTTIVYRDGSQLFLKSV
jgi:hypothetical protein